MKKMAILALTVLSIAGCASKYSILTQYHNQCDAANPDPEAYVGYVNCMNTMVSLDPKISRGSGTINIMAYANQLRLQVQEHKMTGTDARKELQNKYSRIKFIYSLPQQQDTPLAPSTQDAPLAPSPVK
ncbi:Uncharacterised protein [Leminorella richardii]|uniref:Lipoprotein n=1 Tax=Leminorella richardii TaxID=158841 RepID=A0A2X4UYW3_9GAMM|nr:hypothetical protein [Leminorella richardii]SQI44021.1 Uncharacterised protein [Leminorella richardii]